MSLEQVLDAGFKRLVNTVEIEGEIYSKSDLQSAPYEHLKMLLSFCESVPKMRKVANLSGSIEAKLYVDGVEMKIGELNSNRDW